MYTKDGTEMRIKDELILENSIQRIENDMSPRPENSLQNINYHKTPYLF